MGLWQDNVKFPKHFKPLPPGYKIVQLDSGHYLWVLEAPTRDIEGLMSWDRYWVRRCAFAHFESEEARKGFKG